MKEIKRYKIEDNFLDLGVKGGLFVREEDYAALQEQVRALEHEKYNLTQYKAAYVEWQDKTEWVQGDKRLDVLLPWGKHRADVLKDYVERVEGQLKDEIARRDAAAGEPVAYIIKGRYDKENGRDRGRLNWHGLSDRNAEDIAYYNLSATPLYADAQPAVLPPPLDNWHNSASGVMQSLQFKGDELSFTVGANWMRQQCLELGAQQQEVVELPMPYDVDINLARVCGDIEYQHHEF